MANFQELTKSIQSINTIAELRQLNAVMTTHWKILQRKACTQALEQLVEGAKVTFRTKNQQVIEGTITKFNQKTVTVRTVTGSNWRVAPNLLTKV